MPKSGMQSRTVSTTLMARAKFFRMLSQYLQRSTAEPVTMSSAGTLQYPTTMRSAGRLQRFAAHPPINKPCPSPCPIKLVAMHLQPAAPAVAPTHLTTMPVTRPPKTCSATTSQAEASKPCMNPPFRMSRASFTACSHHRTTHQGSPNQ